MSRKIFFESSENCVFYGKTTSASCKSSIKVVHKLGSDKLWLRLDYERWFGLAS